MPVYGYMLLNLSPSPNLYKVQSVYNNNVALVVLTWGNKECSSTDIIVASG